MEIRAEYPGEQENRCPAGQEGKNKATPRREEIYIPRKEGEYVPRVGEEHRVASGKKLWQLGSIQEQRKRGIH